MTTTPSSNTPERAAFEAWMSDYGKWPAAIERSGESYMSMSAASKWITWQARAALSEAAAPEPARAALEAAAEPVVHTKPVRTYTEADDWLKANGPGGWIDDLRNEVDRLREALTELRDRITGHPAYEDLTEDEEMNVGGDTAEFSYLARVANGALARPIDAARPADRATGGKT